MVSLDFYDDPARILYASLDFFLDPSKSGGRFRVDAQVAEDLLVRDAFHKSIVWPKVY